ncbi:MAG: hypothetical protein AAF968_02675 [Pseudomonadota bacterium]
MPTIITRLYGGRGTAESVVDALRGKGLRASEVDLFGDADAGDGLVERLIIAGIAPSAAEGLAARLGSGEGLVIARAPFGEAVMVRDTMDDEVSMTLSEEETYRYAFDQPGRRRGLSVTPDKTYYLSDPKNPPLSRSRHVISEYFGWKMLSGRQPGPKILMENGRKIMPWEPLTDWRLNTAPSKNRTPFSSALNWRTIRQPSAPTNVMRGNPTPFSSYFGWRTLTR